jgi:hypothetical protein
VRKNSQKQTNSFAERSKNNMTEMTNIHPAVRTDIRNTKKRSRIRMALAGSGVAGALFLGSLFGGAHLAHSTTAHTQANVARTSAVVSHAVHTTAHTQAHTTQKSVASSHTTQVKTTPASYAAPNDYVRMARQAASNAGISPDAFQRQIQQESGFNPNAGSPAGAEGIAQFMPGTAASMGVNAYDPSSALPGAARLMAGLASQFGGDYAKALAAYNAGPGAVQSAVAQGGGNWLAHMPAETQQYVATIMG